MKLRANGTVQHERHGDAEVADDHDRDRFPPAEAHGEDGRGRLPCSQVDSVRSPVGQYRPRVPRLILDRSRV